MRISCEFSHRGDHINTLANKIIATNLESTSSRHRTAQRVNLDPARKNHCNTDHPRTKQLIPHLITKLAASARGDDDDEEPALVSTTSSSPPDPFSLPKRPSITLPVRLPLPNRPTLPHRPGAPLCNASCPVAGRDASDSDIRNAIMAVA